MALWSALWYGQCRGIYLADNVFLSPNAASGNAGVLLPFSVGERLVIDGDGMKVVWKGNLDFPSHDVITS